MFSNGAPGLPSVTVFPSIVELNWSQSVLYLTSDWSLDSAARVGSDTGSLASGYRHRIASLRGIILLEIVGVSR